MPARLYDAPSKKTSSRGGKDFGLPANVLPRVGPVESFEDPSSVAVAEIESNAPERKLSYHGIVPSLHFSSPAHSLSPTNQPFEKYQKCQAGSKEMKICRILVMPLEKRPVYIYYLRNNCGWMAK